MTGLPALVAQGDADVVIPRELLDRTWDLLTRDPDAPVVAHRHRGGHELTLDVVEVLGAWIADRVGAADGGHVRTP